jgi:hypothetical protein
MAGMSGADAKIVFYYTSVPAQHKIKTDISRVQRILDAKHATYEPVSVLVRSMT